MHCSGNMAIGITFLRPRIHQYRSFRRLLGELLDFVHHGADFRMNMWGKTSSGNFGRIFGELSIFLPPSIDAAIEKRCVIAMAKVIQGVIGAASHWVPGGGVNHHARIIVYAQLFKSVLELFRGRELSVLAFDKVLQRQESSARNMALIVF